MILEKHSENEFDILKGTCTALQLIVFRQMNYMILHKIRFSKLAGVFASLQKSKYFPNK